MKMLVALLVGAFTLYILVASGLDVTDLITPETVSTKAEELQDVFNPAWAEKFQSADLASKLKAMSGQK